MAPPTPWRGLGRLLLGWLVLVAVIQVIQPFWTLTRPDQIWTVSVLGFVLVFFGGMLLLATSDARRHHRLVRDGEAVTGEIVLASWRGDGEGGRELAITYRYDGGGGEATIGREGIAKVGFEPAAGDTVFVRRDRAKPSVHTLAGYGRATEPRA